MLLAESEEDLQRVVNEFYSVHKRRKLKVNAGKSKVILFERREVEVVDCITAYRVRLPAVARCGVMLGREKMGEVSEFKYLEAVLCKHGGMEGEIRASDERQECCGFARWGNKREKCVYGCEEGLKE